MVDAKISKMEPQIRKKSWGGSRPNSGGRRPGSGRKKGTPNKVTAEIKELAQKYGPEAIAELARLATKAESEAPRVAAIKELLDRGYGRAVQPIEGSVTYGVCQQLAELFKENALLWSRHCIRGRELPLTGEPGRAFRTRTQTAGSEAQRGARNLA